MLILRQVFLDLCAKIEKIIQNQPYKALTITITNLVTVSAYYLLEKCQQSVIQNQQNLIKRSLIKDLFNQRIAQFIKILPLLFFRPRTIKPAFFLISAGYTPTFLLESVRNYYTPFEFTTLQLIELLKMRIYHNFGNQEAEIISDSYKFVYPEDFKGVVIEVQSKMVIPKDVEVDVGCGNAFGGKNEEEEVGGNNAANSHIQKVNDLIDGFGYQPYNISKDDYKTYYIKDYLKIAIKKVPVDKQANFKLGVQAFVKFLLSKFEEFTIYTPKDNSTEGALIYSIYKNEEDEAPIFYYILEGLPSFKV